MATQQKEDILSIATPDPTNVLLARLENWKHAVVLLQDYLENQISTQKSISSGLEKSKKVISVAPKFDFDSGNAAAGDVQEPSTESTDFGIAESFQTMRTKAETLLNKSTEVEASLRGSVAPQLETLKGDIEKHIKGLKGTSLKGHKDVEKAKQTTQKAVEHLGQYTSSSGGSGKVESKYDPYVLHRVSLNAVEDQLAKENSQTDAVLSSQRNFKTLERHVVQVIQQATQLIAQIQEDYASVHTESHNTIAKHFGSISEDHEWQLFTKNNASILVPEDAEKREVSGVTFSNAEHPSVKPVQEGILQRKGKLTKSYNSNYFVLTPSNWLHAFKSADHVTDPTPEWSMYMPESTLGAADEQKAKFTLQGKSSSKGPSLGQKHTYQFKCSTQAELQAWYSALQAACGASFSANDGAAMSPSSSGRGSSPSSPVAASPAAAAGTGAAVGTAGAGAAGTAAGAEATGATGATGAAASEAPAVVAEKTTTTVVSDETDTPVSVVQETTQSFGGGVPDTETAPALGSTQVADAEGAASHELSDSQAAAAAAENAASNELSDGVNKVHLS